MSDGIAEMEKAKSALYTHTDGKVYVLVNEGYDGSCVDCCFNDDDKRCDIDHACHNGYFKPLQSPLAIASAALAEKGTPLVAETSFLTGAEEVYTADVRTFETGATRDSDEGKYDIEAFFNPIVTQRRAEYMHKHRKQSDGAMRDGDNWQSGMPYRESLKSLCRHTEDIKLISRGYEVFEKDKHGEFKLDDDGEKIPVTIGDAICAAQFNLDSMLLTRLTEK